MDKEKIIYVTVDPPAAGGNSYRDKTEALLWALECDMLRENPAYRPIFLQQSDDEKDLEKQEKLIAKIKDIVKN